jgi:putative phosphoesterase
MRIGITSDIHTDISPANHKIIKHLADVAKHNDLDVFIICGDISPSPLKFSQTISAFQDLPCKKLLVAGNHDIWITNTNSDITSYQKYDLITAICKEHDFHHLGNSPVITDKVGFCGTIGWYDYSFKSDKYPISEKSYMQKTFGGSVWNDVNFARWKAPDPNVAKKFEDDLQEQIDSIRDQVSRIMVITHHVPFRECVTYRNELPWDFFSAFMGSEGLGEICFNEPLVTHTVFGHTHAEFFEELKRHDSHSLWAVCSPIGYLTDPPKNLVEYAQSRIRIIEL